MAWTELGGIRSKTSRSRVYSLDVNEDGELRCSCPSFIHSLAPKYCKHTDSAEAAGMLRRHLESKRTQVPRISTIARDASNVYWAGGYRQGVAIVPMSALHRAEAALNEAQKAVRIGFVTAALREALRNL